MAGFFGGRGVTLAFTRAVVIPPQRPVRGAMADDMEVVPPGRGRDQLRLVRVGLRGAMADDMEVVPPSRGRDQRPGWRVPGP